MKPLHDGANHIAMVALLPGPGPTRPRGAGTDLYAQHAGFQNSKVQDATPCSSLLAWHLELTPRAPHESGSQCWAVDPSAHHHLPLSAPRLPSPLSFVMGRAQASWTGGFVTMRPRTPRQPRLSSRPYVPTSDRNDRKPAYRNLYLTAPGHRSPPVTTSGVRRPLTPCFAPRSK
ncbi:uncharacterized protein B0I36DRAFT_348206 [Microdochium trichocladiopsis]|uniref:Uncharacterized protein n=1 Tax=Microdochium trichocladiopsis TaxID=1682393 RepID=A0A9P8YBE2_9PEZI|nr:uncharacterized protein B0I36DRAFT_348206 [Microdochium trichocladiopsis]KAH7033097.1 hypothetical protein B0I36DRAFT_348206 [Microdochium trichocladiopsis]